MAVLRIAAKMSDQSSFRDAAMPNSGAQDIERPMAASAMCLGARRYVLSLMTLGCLAGLLTPLGDLRWTGGLVTVARSVEVCSC